MNMWAQQSEHFRVPPASTVVSRAIIAVALLRVDPHFATVRYIFAALLLLTNCRRGRTPADVCRWDHNQALCPSATHVRSCTVR